MSAQGRGSSDALVAIGREKYISLTTFRRNGEGVATPIWFAVDGHRLVAFTGAQTGKAKRIAHTSRVTVAASTFKGRVKGPTLEAEAIILPDAAQDQVMPLIRRKYRVTKFLLDTVVGAIRLVTRKPQTHSVYLEIRVRA